MALLLYPPLSGEPRDARFEPARAEGYACAVSKAFKKDDADDEPLIVPARAPLPEGVHNYVTQRGLNALQSERAQLLEELGKLGAESDQAARNALKARLAELEQRLLSAELVAVEKLPREEVRFGARVELLDASGRAQRYRIVGVDEANVREGRVAFTAPLARALLGKRVGDAVLVRTPHGEDELELTEISYAED